MRSPCLISLDYWNLGDLELLMTIEIDEEETQDMMSLTKLVKNKRN